MIRKELATLGSENVSSVLCDKSSGAMKTFTWNTLIEELQKHTPVLLEILYLSTKTRKHRSVNQNAIIGICCAILCRYRSQRMSLIQRIVSILLYVGHAGKQVHL